MIITAVELTEEPFQLVEQTIDKQPAFPYFLNRVKATFNQKVANTSKFQARDYQLESAASYCIQPRNLAGLSQGLGKTLISSLVIAALYPELEEDNYCPERSRYVSGVLSKPGRVQIAISSSTAVERWMEDLATIFPTENFCYLSKAKDLQSEKAKAPIWVYTHDFLKLKANKLSRPQLGRVIKQKFPPSLLVIDEVHHLGNRKSQRYVELDGLSRRAKRVLGLSGTITEGQLDALDSILAIVYQRDWIYFRQPKLLGLSLGEDVHMGTSYQTGDVIAEGKRLQTVNWSKLSSYYQLMRAYLHRISIDEPAVRASIQIPETKIVHHVLEMENAQKQQYLDYLTAHKLELEFLARQSHVSAAQQNKARSLLHPLIQICNIQEGISVKAAKAIECTRSAKRTAIFCQHVDSARYIYRLLQAEFGNDNVVRLYANDDLETPKVLKPEQRWEVIRKFESNQNIRAGVFSLNLAAEAIDLLAADQVIFYCLPWSATKLDQALRRSLRPGNQHPEVTITYITHSWGIDRYQLQLLEQKNKIASLLLDYETGVEHDEAVESNDLAGISQSVLDALLSL